MRNESAQNLDDVRIRSWILSSTYPTCSFFSLARTTTRTLRMVIKGDNRRRQRMFCFCKSTRSFARFKAFCALFFSREKERTMRGKKYNVTHRTSVQSHENTKSCQNALLCTHTLSLSTEMRRTAMYTALCFSPSSSSIIASFLTRAQKT
jgi:hypothetical protein